MDSIGVQALLMAGLFGLSLGAISVMMIVSWSRAARGRLARNPYVGVRTPSTLRSEQSWVAGNRAALRLVPLYLLVNAATFAALVVVGWQGWRLGVIFAGSGGLVALIMLSICAAVIASRAARAGADTSAARQTSEALDFAGLFSGRAMTIAGWIVAVTICAASVCVLVTLIDGYVLATHHELEPNGVFGFRDAATRACLPAWYAAQKAGFSWVLFGYGPFVALSIVFAVVAAIKRRSPWVVSAMAVTSLLSLIFAVVIAGIHADSVARAITC